MPRLESERGFVGAVRDQESGDLIQLDAEVDADVAERLADAHAHLSVAGDSDPNPEGSDAEEGDAKPTCGVNGCGRKVESEDATCWQHSED